MASSTTPQSLWQQTLDSLRGEIDPESFRAWIAPLRVERWTEGRLTLACPSDVFRNWVASNFEEQIEFAFAEAAGRDVSISYVLDHLEEDDLPSDLLELEAERPRGRNGSVQGAFHSTELKTQPLNPEYTFDKFIVGESNRFAYAAAMAVADPESRAYNPLFLYGGVGLGKTHLMHAIGRQLLAYGPRLNVLYVSSEIFMNAFIEGIKAKDLTSFRNCFRTADLLLIDDVQFFSGAERSQTEFFHTFNTLFEAGKKIVISSDQPPRELTDLDERLRSRFEAGLIVDIQPPDLETRVAILLKKAQDHRVELSAEVAIYIAERIKTNIRKLEGALKKLAAQALVADGPIDIATARTLLGPIFAGQEPVRITIEKIQLAVCNYFNLDLHDLTGSRRARKYTFPRHVATYLAREITHASYPELARKFGGRDHTSIMHSHRKIREEVESDLHKQNLIKYLTKVIKDEPISQPPA